MCEKISSIETSFEIVIIRHQREGYKTTNTARIAALGLQRCTILDYLPETFRESSIDCEDAALLFPTEEESSKKTPRRLYVLDGTWKQASRMTHKIRALYKMPRVSFSTSAPEAPRIRQPNQAHQRTTLEAIAMAVEHFDGKEAAAPVYDLYQQMVTHICAARGFLPADVSVE